MAQAQDRNSKGRSKGKRTTRSKAKTKPRDKTQKTPLAPAINAIHKIENIGVRKIPSNAPTMAIAPSDYEHIFHEGPPAAGNGTSAAIEGTRQQGIPTIVPQPPPPTAAGGGVNRPLGFAPGGAGTQAQRPHFGGGTNYARQGYEPPVPHPPPPPPPSPQTDVPLQVTQDGYTLMGQSPDESSRRFPLPPHIVRANNQFSRAALVKISNYLASRAENV